MLFKLKIRRFLRFASTKKIIIFGIFLSYTACAYRFTNLHLKAPEGIRSIAIESIYDTSKIVLPHEILWQKVQEQFALLGKLRVSSQETADAYLRIHIKSAEQKPHSIESFKTKNPKSFLDPYSNPKQPYSLEKYPNQRIVDTFAKYENLNLTLIVEGFDLRQNKKLMMKSYNMDLSYTIYNGSIRENSFLTLEEEIETAFTHQSNEIARKIATDFLAL